MTTKSRINAHEVLQQLGEGDLRVLESLKHMTEGSFRESGLDPDTFVLLRIASLAAIDASTASWIANLRVAGAVDLDPERVVGALVAIAPVIGTARVVSAAGSAMKAIAIHRAREREKEDGR
jgi:hypothetical protein